MNLLLCSTYHSKLMGLYEKQKKKCAGKPVWLLTKPEVKQYLGANIAVSMVACKTFGVLSVDLDLYADTIFKCAVIINLTR